MTSNRRRAWFILWALTLVGLPLVMHGVKEITQREALVGFKYPSSPVLEYKGNAAVEVGAGHVAVGLLPVSLVILIYFGTHTKKRDKG